MILSNEKIRCTHSFIICFLWLCPRKKVSRATAYYDCPDDIAAGTKTVEGTV